MMDKKFTVAILGLGGRGYVYASLLKQHKDQFEVAALCDINPKQIEKVNRLLDLPEEQLFLSEEEFFREKRADILVISTWDKFHVRQSIQAMELGYHVLLEKPISDSEEELAQLLDTQRKTGKTVVICHVLRYSSTYRKLFDLLQEGAVGRLMAIDAVERVAYWHQAQAYVRLQSQVNDISHPTILAKCCHDLDYIQHFAQAKCDTVSSLGGMGFFRAENMPEGAAERCLDCKYADSCTYSAKKIYIDGWHKAGCPAFEWPYNKISLKDPNTEADLYEGLKTVVQGKCAFRCGVEHNPYVVDHQMVQMRFENGVVASLRMLFGAEPGRWINLFGTHGEIVFDERLGTIEVKRYGEEKEIIAIHTLNTDEGYGHGGGDGGLVNELYDIITGRKTEYTSLTESMESHLIGIRAEQSRLNGGITLKVHNP